MTQSAADPSERSTEPDPASLDFETALKQLEEIVQRLERGEVPLEESITLYERGNALKRICEGKLEAARTRIETITLDAAGKATGTRPLDAD